MRTNTVEYSSIHRRFDRRGHLLTLCRNSTIRRDLPSSLIEPVLARPEREGRPSETRDSSTR